MGNGLTTWRNARNQPQGNGDIHTQSPPGDYPPFYHSNGNQNNQQYVVNIQPSPYGPRQPLQNIPLPDIENHKANTIKNDVNVKKSSLRLERDEQNPGFYLVAFTFDAIAAGWICIFFLAREGDQCGLTPLKPELYTPIRVPFQKGLGQSFRQAPGTGVDLSLFMESELFDESLGDVFPLVVRTETVPKLPPEDAIVATNDFPINDPLPRWIHAQTTHAVLEKRDDDYSARVVKQIIYVEGIRYELQEIYGIENADGGHGHDVGKECVICLSELRDTTVLPCRHMCMCSGCAKVLRFQSSRCPICRTPVERLLEIKVSNKNDGGRENVNETQQFSSTNESSLQPCFEYV